VSLRLLEVIVPDQPLEGVLVLLQDVNVVQVWTAGPPEAPGLVRILLDAHEAEQLSDRLVRRYGSLKDFRLILLPVVATQPAVEKPSAEEVTVGPRRISREELYEHLAQASRLTGVYVVMVALSTVVAAVGLLRGDVAIIIGAIVIAQLQGPNVALSLACTLGDPVLARRSQQGWPPPRLCRCCLARCSAWIRPRRKSWPGPAWMVATSHWHWRPGLPDRWPSRAACRPWSWA
jgi:hypothetical protein